MLRTREDAPPIIVAPKIALGFCDVCASGARALLGLQPPPGGRRQEWQLESDRLGQTCLRPQTAESTADAGPAQFVTLFNNKDEAVCSMLIVLSGVDRHQEVNFAASVCDFLYKAAAKAPMEWLILAAARLPVSDTTPDNDVPVYHVPINGTTISDTTWKFLQPSTRTPDGCLAALMHCCRAREEDASFVLVPGHRIMSIAQASEEEYIKLACKLSVAATKALGCGMCEDSIRNVEVDHMWYPETHETIPIYT